MQVAMQHAEPLTLAEMREFLADSGPQVEAPGQTVTGPLEEIVVRRGAQQKDRFAFVLPVSRVLGPGPDAAFVSRLRADRALRLAAGFKQQRAAQCRNGEKHSHWRAHL